MVRDKVNLQIFWRLHESSEDPANLPGSGVPAAEIADELRAALAQFEWSEDELEEEQG